MKETIKKLLLLFIVLFNLNISISQITTQPKDTILCYGSNTIIYTTVLQPANAIYQWQDSTSGAWNNLITGALTIGVTNDTLALLNNISGSHYLRCLIDTNADLTIDLITNTVNVFTLLPIQKAIISASQEICYNTIPDTLRVTTLAAGADESFTYQWQQSANGTVWSYISSANQLKYLPSNLTSSLYYRIASTSTFACGTKYSDSILVTVYAPLTPGVIGNSQYICYNTTPNQFSITTSPSGGGNLYTYQWKTSLDSINFVNINSTTNTYQEINLNAHKFYKVQVTSTKGCGVLETNIIKVHVYNPVIAGSISGNDTICYNTIPNVLTGINATGGNGLFNYQWLKSTNLTTWSDVIGATLINYNPLALAQTTYYKLAYTSQYGCGSDTSNYIKIHVWPVTQKSLISGTQEICYNTIPDTLKVTTIASGADENFTYQWQQSSNGTVWNNISTANQLKYVAGNLISNNYYRIASTSTFACGTKYSDSILVTVYAPLTPGIIGNSQFICYNTTPNQFSFISNPSGGGGLYSYQWKASLDSVNFANISSTTNTYQEINLNAHKFYKVQLTSTKGCGALVTNIIKVHVYNPVVAGSISGNDTVCYNTIPNGLTGINATGGNGLFNYQWLQSTNQTSWSSVGTATAINFNPPALSLTTYYKLAYTSQYGCGADTSNSIKILVWPLTQKAIISASQEICYNTIPDTLRVTTLASGADESFTYQWQQSANGTVWSNISSANQLKYLPPNLTSSLYYRIASTSTFACGTKYSDSILVTVYAPLTQGIIGNSQFICYNTTPNQFSFLTNPSGGGSLYSYQWKASLDSVNFVNISSTTNTYQDINLNAHKFYKVQLTSTKGCGVLETNIIKVHVYNPVVAGSISGNDTVCFNTIPNGLTGINATGGNGLFNYQWLQSNNQTSWSNVGSATAINFNPPALSITTYYKLAYTSQYGCGADTSNSVKILVWPYIQKPIISGFDTICYNTIPDTLKVTTQSIGADGLFHYQWQNYSNGSWYNISNDTNLILIPGNLIKDTLYRIKSTSDFGCGVLYSDSVKIKVYLPLTSGIIKSNQNICYNTTPTQLNFLINPSGGGDFYFYQWEISTDSLNFSDILGATSNNYVSGNLTNTHYYRLKVTSIMGCGILFTNIIKVNVYAPVQAGIISGNDTICFGETPNALLTNILPVGGPGTFIYQWHSSNNQILWTNIQNAQSINYTVPALYDTTFYYLEYIADSGCGSSVSNTLEVIVNPLPPVITFIGPVSVCNNQQDVSYSFSPSSNDITYNWSISGGNIITPKHLSSAIVDWDKTSGLGTLGVKQTINQTGCNLNQTININLSLNSAPDKDTIFRKSNSNILISKEKSDNIHYQWGYIDLSNNISFDIENSDRRYALYPIGIDTTKYRYWLKTFFVYSLTETCSTTSFYHELGKKGNKTSGFEFSIFPNPTKDELTIKAELIENSNITIRIYDLSGKLMKEEVIYDVIILNSTLSLNLLKGMYLIEFRNKNEKSIQKLIIQ